MSASLWLQISFHPIHRLPWLTRLFTPSTNFSMGCLWIVPSLCRWMGYQHRIKVQRMNNAGRLIFKEWKTPPSFHLPMFVQYQWTHTFIWRGASTVPFTSMLKLVLSTFFNTICPFVGILITQPWCKTWSNTDTLFNVQFRINNKQRTTKSFCPIHNKEGNYPVDEYHGMPFFATYAWSDNNHISSTAYYKNMLKGIHMLLRPMEGPMQYSAPSNCTHMGQQIYGERGDGIAHICHLDGRLNGTNAILN